MVTESFFKENNLSDKCKVLIYLLIFRINKAHIHLFKRKGGSLFSIYFVGLMSQLFSIEPSEY
jgi:hypothetical protein